MPESIRFDRAVDYYDRTRALPDDVAAEVVSRLRAAIGRRRRNVEIGVGTGRIALPLRRAGIPVVGVDLSEPMLRKLADNARRETPLPVAVADATRLPFPAESLDSVVACHVLHLIPRWQDAVTEIRRVLRPGGAFLLDLGGGPGGTWREVFRRVGAAVGKSEPRVGLTDVTKLHRLAGQLGLGGEQLLEPVVFTVRRPLDDAFDQLRQRLHAWTWDIDPEAMGRAVAETRAWARREIGDVTTPIPVETTIQWRVFTRR